MLAAQSFAKSLSHTAWRGVVGRTERRVNAFGNAIGESVAGAMQSGSDQGANNRTLLNAAERAADPDHYTTPLVKYLDDGGMSRPVLRSERIDQLEPLNVGPMLARVPRLSLPSAFGAGSRTPYGAVLGSSPVDFSGPSFEKLAAASMPRDSGTLSSGPGLWGALANIANSDLDLGQKLQWAGRQIKSSFKANFLAPNETLVELKDAGLRVPRSELERSVAAANDPNASFFSRWANTMTANYQLQAIGATEGLFPTNNLELGLTAAGAVSGVPRAVSRELNALAIDFRGNPFLADQALSVGSSARVGKVETLYRVDDAAFAPRIAEDGSVPLVMTKSGAERALFVNIGQADRMRDFALINRGGDVTITAVDVDASLLERLRTTAVYDKSTAATLNPSAPLVVDITKAPDQYGLRTSDQIQWLRDTIQPGTARRIDPKTLKTGGW